MRDEYPFISGPEPERITLWDWAKALAFAALLVVIAALV